MSSPLTRLPLAAASLVLVASLSEANTPFTGIPTLPDGTCGTAINAAAAPYSGELYAVKVTASNTSTDWVCDTRTKGGVQVGGAEIDSTGWLVPSNWSVSEAPSDDVHVYMTMDNSLMVVDGGNIGASLGSLVLEVPQTVGDTLIAGLPGLQGLGVSLPSDGSQYAVPLLGGTQMFPFGGKSSIELAFGPLAEVNGTDISGGNQCHVGAYIDADDGTSTEDKPGYLIGYNIYRVAGPNAPGALTLAQYVQSWVYFARIDGFNMHVADGAGTSNGTPPRGNGTDAPTDPSADTDLVGWNNADAIPYNGNEIVIFSDQATNPNGSARAGGASGPVAGTTYWYAFQPVVVGDTTAMDSAVIAGVAGSGRSFDADGDTVKESVDLDGNAADGPEFFSPQAKLGANQGLGLTHGGSAFTCKWIKGQVNPAAATGNVVLTGSLSGGTVNLTLNAAIEAGNVLGFNVYRLDGANRVKVNDQVIAARGGEGNLYTLVDEAQGTSQRIRRDSTLQYVVDVLYNDGTATETVGPFAVTAGRGQTQRRSR